MDEERGIVWFPSVINMGEKGIIYPDGNLRIGIGITLKL